ncbi:hypothetical protein CDV31_009348 [Fusarium ambrosium]|uniref:Uncharacterized protein n=1 Tax=Fusarium ambrosium TaxID=131363 RepID=A0A428TVI8_9HYPO|nr:hypothetical protein CDV31_009348 [Fusarium ambrosium]
MPSDFLRCRARQVQRYARARPPQPFADLITKKDLLRAANLEKDFALSLSPEDEPQWPSNWSSNSLSLKSFLRCRSWMRLRVPPEPKNDVVKQEVIVIEDSEDEDGSESGDTFESGDDQVQKANEEPESFIENDVDKPNEGSGDEQNAGETLMAFCDRGNNDSPVEEILRDRPIPQPDRHFTYRATRSTYFTTQQSTSAFTQPRPTFVVPSYVSYGMPYPSYPPPFTPVVATGYSIVQTSRYYPPPLPVFGGFRPQPVLAYATQDYEQYVDDGFTPQYSRVDEQSYDQEQQHHASPSALRGHRRQY